MRTFSLATVERPGPHQEPEEARQVAALAIGGRLYPLDSLAPRGARAQARRRSRGSSCCTRSRITSSSG